MSIQEPNYYDYFNPVPSKEYDSLLSQFNSAVILIRTQRAMIAQHSKDYNHLYRMKSHISNELIEYERNVNEMLTNDIERLEKENEKLKEKINGFGS